MQLWQYCLLHTAKLLYMFRTLSASITRGTKTVEAATGACHGSGLCISSKDVRGQLPLHYVIDYLGLTPYWIFFIPTYDMNQWLLLQFLYS